MGEIAVWVMISAAGLVFAALLVFMVLFVAFVALGLRRQGGAGAVANQVGVTSDRDRRGSAQP